jgi:PAS domain S-box-containing protein
MPVLLCIPKICERIRRLAEEAGCGGAPNLEWCDSKHAILTNNTAPGLVQEYKLSGVGRKTVWNGGSGEEIYFASLDSLPFPVWTANERGRCAFHNQAALVFLGKTQEGVLAEGWAGFVHPDDIARLADQLASLSHSSSPRQIEFRMRSSAGDYRWFLCNLAPRYDGSGRISGCVGYSVDISSFKKTTEAFFHSETRYRQLFDSNLIGAMYTSVSGGILDANQKFLEMVGYPASDIKAGLLRWIDITPPEYKAQAESNAEQLRATGIFKPVEKEYIRNDGSRVPVLVTSALLEGSTTEAITFVVDITEHKRAEQAMRQQAESLANGQIAALNRTLTLLATEPSLDTALSHVLKAISEQLSVTSSGLHLAGLNPSDTLLHMNYDDGQITRGEDINDPSALHPRHVALITERWKAQKDGFPKPVILDVAASSEFDDQRRARLLANKIHTLLLVPLLVHNRLVGTLSIRIKERRTLRAAEIELAQALAQQASLAVHLTHLAERLRQVAILEERNLAATGRAAELARANQALKQTLDVLANDPEIDEVLGHVLTVVTQVLEGSVSTLWLRDRDAETAKLHLVFRDGHLVSGAESGHRLAGQTLDLSRQDLFAFAVFRRGRPVWHEVATSEALDEAAKTYLREQGVKALLGIPLILADKAIGAIVVRFPELRQFGSVELELAQGLAQQATLALQLTRLAEQARKAAITEERNRMAREIHDTLAQSFTGVLIQLQAARQVLDGVNPEATQHLESAIALARVGLTEARRSVRGLRPQLLRDGNITTALDQLVRQLGTDSLVRINFSANGDAQRLMSPDIESNLLRISQEAITNAMKHSGANQINVRLSAGPEAVQLAIEDNGAGFDPHVSTLSRGFGLISMQERADRIGGDLTILTKPGAGTKIHLLLPILRTTKLGEDRTRGSGHSPP